MANWGGDVRTDGRMDGRTDGRKDGRTSGNSPLCPTGHRPFGAAAQKVSKTLVFPLFNSMTTDRRTDGRTDGRTDKASYRVACPQLKRKKEINEIKNKGKIVKQVTRGHNIVADGWAGASNPHPHQKPPPSLKHTQLVIQELFLTAST